MFSNLKERAKAAQIRYKRWIVHNKRRNDCIEALVREGIRHGRKIILLLERLPHLRIMSYRLRDIEHAMLAGAFGDKEDRITAKQSMDDGRLNLIIASRIFAKGIDIRVADMVIDATALKSANWVVQRLGRGTRLAEGKNGFIFISIQDVDFKHVNRQRREALAALKLPSVDVIWGIGAGNVYAKIMEKMESS